MDFEEFLSLFDSLPFHVSGKIMDFLQLSEKKNSRLVSHRWNYIVANYCKNVKFGLILKNTSLDQFIISNQRFDIIYIQGLTKPFPEMSYPNNNFPNIKHVNLYDLNSEDTIMNIFKYGLEYTKSLHISYDSLKSVPRYVISGNIQHFKWDHLMTLCLRVMVREENKNHFDSASTLLEFAKIPNLREFLLTYVDDYHVNNQHIEIKTFFLNMYTFFANHSKSLKELNFVIECNRNYNAGRQMPQIEDSRANGLIGSNMNIQICELSLMLEVKNLGFEYLIYPCVIGSKLKNLSIHIWSAQDFEHNNLDTFRPIFEANLQNLESVSIYAKTTVNLFWVNECPILKSVALNVKDLILPTKVTRPYPLKLKIFHYWRDVLQFPYEQLLVHFGNEIEALEVNGSPRDYSLDWINPCVALKYLYLCVHMNLLPNIRISFPNMIEFELCFWKDSDTVSNAATAILNTPHANKNNWKWIAQNMPNLQILKISGCPELHPTCLICLQTAFTMEKLIKIYFNFDVRLKCDLDEEPRITEHCENIPGLYFKRIYTKNFHGVPGSYISTKSLIKIDHSIYKIST